jgi:membrane associated rhomboid family serine protease
MMMFLLAVLVLGGYALYTMSPEERIRLKDRLVDRAQYAREEAARRQAEPEPFRDALRERTRWPVVMPALVAVNVIVFVMMGWSSAATAEPEPLVAWGASFGPRTTNGEWWRLISSMFVHAGFIQLVVNCAALVQLGLILERLVGHITFAAVFVAAGVLASLVSVSDYPMAVSAGASGGIFGLYGLLLASTAWSAIQRGPAPAAEPQPVALGTFGFRELPRAEPVETRDDGGEPDRLLTPSVRMTLTAAKRLAPVAAIFLLFNMVSGAIGGGAELAGFAAGFICGIVLTSGVSATTPSVRRVAVTMAITVVVAVASAVPLRGLTDIRPEISRVLAVEESTSSAYQGAVKQFKLGTVTADGLAQMIERKITPELHALQARLKALGRIPPEHQPLLSSAEEYLRLRDESWRLRAAALHKASMPALRKAETAERASLEAFERLKPVEPSSK